MALELFKPFIYHRLEQTGHCTTIKQAKEMVEQQESIVWDILEEVIKDHPVLLNRAPTLHRLGIQAFEPVLVEGKAIKIHPLVCTAFNADFDGDQMAVHIPLSPEAQIEASVLMLASHNILSPASGQPITVPTQDLVLGLYYLTKAKVGAKGEGRVFANIEEVLMALEAKQVETLTPIRLRHTGPVLDMTVAYDDQDILHTEAVEFNKQFINTTVGRAILNDSLPEGMPYVNGLLKKKGIGQLINYLYLNLGLEVTVHALDKIKELGFQYATRSGLSVGLDDMVIPDSKYTLVSEAEKTVIAMQQQYLDGSITNLERSNKVTQMWSGVTERVADEMFNNMKRADKEGAMNPIYIMADSGARGSKQQIRQLSGMRGLMAKPSGEIIETPITANFREGLTVLQYFISTHGARKGLAVTALKTADSGYLTRRLVDVAQDVIISEHDCGTVEGIYVMPIIEAGETIEPLRDRIIGRVSLEKLKDFEGKMIVDINDEIDEDKASAVQAAGIERVKIRSVLTCESKRGCCILCYGRNLGSGKMVEMGEAVGVIAAQSIGEPGTQLTMRTFHIGGTASRVQDASHLEAKNAGKVHFINLVTVRSKDGGLVAFNRNGSIAIIDAKGREKERYAIVYGAKLKVEDGQAVKLGDTLGEWDPYTFSILTEIAGTVQFKDLQEGVTLNEEIDEVTGLSRLVVGDSPDEKRQPAIIIKGEKGTKRYLMPSRAHLMLQDGDEVTPGDILAKIPRETTRTKDITGGLPRVVELFEARKPRDPAIISKIDGVVRFGDVSKGQRKVYVTADNGQEEEYSVPRGVYVNVQEGERLRAGDALIDGPRNPHDILEVLGERELQQYLVNEIQEVYRLQGVSISDKHIETIVRQMLRWVKVEEVGDTNFLLEQQIDRFRFNAENQRVLIEGGRPAIGRPLLLGITKASLSTDSFISAASFQETTRVLTEASINGSVDTLRGLKENVIVGRLIPAGTGMEYYRNVQLSPELEEAAAQVQQEVTAAIEAEERELEQMRMEGEQEELAAE
jgi:DNA-directed RNA polymerase subunit beta'